MVSGATTTMGLGLPAPETFEAGAITAKDEVEASEVVAGAGEATAGAVAGTVLPPQLNVQVTLTRPRSMSARARNTADETSTRTKSC